MFELIIFVIFFLMFMSSLMYNVILTLKIQKLIKSLFQVNLDYFIVADQLKKASKADNEGFVEFLNKSRDDAFKYIEDVQLALNIFKEEVGPIINYHEQFGDVIYHPMGEQLNTVALAYRKLMLMLPNDINNDEDEQSS